MKTKDIIVPALKRAGRAAVATGIAALLANMQQDPKWLLFIPIFQAIGKAIRSWFGIRVPF